MTQGSAIRVRGVVWAAIAVLVLTAGLTTVLWMTVGPGAGGNAPTAAPRVTVTAEPGPESEAGAADAGAGRSEATAPITAQEVPGDLLTQQDSDLGVAVGPGVDLRQHSLDDPASPWVVVNKARPIDPQSWQPPQLEAVDGAELVPAAATALEQMIAAAHAADAPLRAATGYRAYGFQQTIYQDYANKWGRERADRFSARAGFSEHQTGWVVDLFQSESCRLQTCFADEPAGTWVAAHAHEYGFVVRYPLGAEAITGYTFEPWHLRYVGVELATAMREHNIATLEQVFDLPAAPDYS